METIEVREHVARVSELRQLIREVGDGASQQELLQLLEEAQGELKSVRQFGDSVLAAFFGEDRPKARELKRREYADLVVHDRSDGVRELLRDTEPPLVPFHWEVEFPEVFDRENPGFDAIVGNPPFAGHTTIVDSNARGYTEWLRMLHAGSAGKCDVIAHFFRRAFGLIRENGTLGLIATNTIAQGDTRASGLRWICKNGGAIYCARRRIKWPGEAAVVVSVIHIFKGPLPDPKVLDNREVDMISAFLFHQGGHDDPERLTTNAGKSFEGSVVLGMGFTFDDTYDNGVATPLSTMHRLIENEPRNKEIILPYLGGEEVNKSPTHMHHRYIIDFGEREEEECWRHWPNLMAIVEENVKPARKESARRSKSSHGTRAGVWWQHYHRAKEMYIAIAGLDRVLVISEVGQHGAFAFTSSRKVFAHTLKVFPYDTYAAFCALQSRPHEIWARFFGSSLEDRLRYTPSDCFETFPFPVGWETDSTLEAAGREYYEFRAALMIQNGEGLTKSYNRFHDAEERSPDIIELRRLHSAMDRVILDAYDWGDISTGCEFLLDYEIDEGWGKKKKPWRYRWPDGVRDEVLARLMALNVGRAHEERLAGRKSQLAKAALVNQTLTPPIRDSAAARHYLTDALRLDLIGPRTQDAALQHERLPQAPSRWYLTGFLVPTNAPDEQRAHDNEEELDEPTEPFHGSDDSSTPDRSSGKRNFLPSSMGLSILVDDETECLNVVVSWGDYSPETNEPDEPARAQKGGVATEKGDGPDAGSLLRRFSPWIRHPREEMVTVSLSNLEPGLPVSFTVPDGGGLEVVCLVRPTTVRAFGGYSKVRAVSVFIVNRRLPLEDTDGQDTAFAFQVEMSVEPDRSLVPRPNLHGLDNNDWDERLADLHYSDITEYAVGHNVSTTAEVTNGECQRVRTEWMPQVSVERTEPADINDVEFGMEPLGSLPDAAVGQADAGPVGCPVS